jgi:hypothetical protein
MTRTSRARSEQSDREMPRRPRRKAAESSYGEDDEPREEEDEPRRSRRQTKEDETDPMDEGHEEEPSGEVTRCICGHQELQTHHINKGRTSSIDPGLFIQCDKCMVWQHGYCVGFMSEDEVPEVYFCERCRPDLHVVVVRPSGKTSKYVPHATPDKLQHEHKEDTKPEKLEKPDKPENPDRKGRKVASSSEEREDSNESVSPKGTHSPREPRRRTLNSRDAAYEETLKRVLEESVHDANIHATVEESDSKRRRSDTEREQCSDSSTTKRKDRSRNSPVKKSEPIKEEQEHDDVDTTVNKTADKLDNIASDKPENLKQPEEDKESIPSRPSTPAPETKRKRQRRNPRSSGNNSAASSTPKPTGKELSKPRIPQSRSTMAEMRKRVAAILEFIGRTQVDLATEQKERQQLLTDRNNRHRELFGDQPNGNSNGFDKLFELHQANLDQMDGLTRKLLLWEQQFGRYGEGIKD